MSKECFHCKQTITKTNLINKEIEQKNQVFCCVGCASVCEMIYQSGLSSFYTHQSNNLLPKIELEHKAEVYDSEAFQNVFLDHSDSQYKSITLSSPTIHCAACIWLIEKTLAKLKGIKSVKVNLASKRIHITWQANLKLSTIMQKLATLGYAAIPFESNIQEEIAKKQHRIILYRIIFASFTMMNLLWISISLYSGASEGKFLNFFNLLSFALATPTLFYSGFPFLKNAFLGLKARHMNMDLPISIGALATYFYSTYLLFFTATSLLYFDTVVNFIFVILIGRFFETQAKQKAMSHNQTLQQLQPKILTTLVNNEEIIKPLLLVKVGDIVLVRPGEKIGIDGEIILGQTQINESLLTGEAKPLNKGIGENVFSGTINHTGSIQIKVTKTFQQSRLKQIINLVAQANPSKLECTIDKIIPFFVITTLSLALLTFFYWAQTDLNLAILSAVSVLIITCPCAFGIATPMSMAVASSIATKNNILIKNNLILEQFHNIKEFIFDKTGTLTTGKMSIIKIINFANTQNLFDIIASIESYSEHPIAKSITFHNKSKPFNKLSVNHFQATLGGGVEGVINNKTYYIGSLKFCLEKTIHKFERPDLPNIVDTEVYCCDENQLLGVVVLNDKLKEDTQTTLAQLQKLGKKITILTGDKEANTQHILQNIKGVKIISQQSPEDKANYIKRLQQKTPVAMIGDGFNDAIALAQANISIVIGSGADVAHQYADCILLSKDLKPLLTLIHLSKDTQKTIKQNIIFALVYNALVLPLAMMAQITPLFAAILMPISSLVVIINASFLRRKKKQRKK
jgi:Cu2+-exporting ATPase